MIRSRLALVTLLTTVALPAGAEICLLDPAPGATLLLPYFEVDLDDPRGVTTIFSVNNLSAVATLARVVLWTDAAYPTLGFEIYLTGYDVQSVNLRDVFAGRLPATGLDISPVGPISRPGSDLASCNSDEPPAGPTAIFLRRAHTGRAIPELGGQCAGLGHGGALARGYVTIDVVDDCTDLMPSDPGYFEPGGPAAFDNVLWGDYLFLEPAAGNARGDELIALEADPEALAFEPTFYGRYVAGSGRDAREPLPTLWANRFHRGGAISSSTIVWRDTGAAPESFDCDAGPSWYPLGWGEVVSFDEQETPVFVSTDIQFLVDPRPFPAATQTSQGLRFHANGWEWIHLDPDPAQRSQSYVAELLSADGRFSLLRTALPLDDGCSVTTAADCPASATPPGILCLGMGGPYGPSPAYEAGEPIPVFVQPRGCFSSSCTIVHRALCDVRQVDATTLEVETSFCLRQVEGVCTEDCGGAVANGGVATCATDALPEGTYLLRAGELELEFTVPITGEPQCVGSPF